MSLVVHALGAYASYPREKFPWRRRDYDVNKLVKSLKGEKVNGYADLRGPDNQWHQVSNEDRQPALRYFAAWAADRVESLGLGRVVLVPMPSSNATTYRAVSAPFEMASVIHARLGRTTSVERWLRFHRPMTKSHEGGTRRVDVLKENLRVSSQIVRETTIVLVDDVKTTGAHIKACAGKLRDAGVSVQVCLVAAATVWKQVPDPFAIAPEDLEAPFDFD